MGYFIDKVGVDFETELLEKISIVSMREWGKGAFNFSTIKEDKLEGKDCTVLGVPIDITLDYANKSRMRKINRYIIIDGITISFGIRFGSSRHSFLTPVLVIGFENPLGVTKDNIGYTVESLAGSLKEILDIGMDEYFACV